MVGSASRAWMCPRRGLLHGGQPWIQPGTVAATRDLRFSTTLRIILHRASGCASTEMRGGEGISSSRFRGSEGQKVSDPGGDYGLALHSQGCPSLSRDQSLAGNMSDMPLSLVDLKGQKEGVKSTESTLVETSPTDCTSGRTISW